MAESVKSWLRIGDIGKGQFFFVRLGAFEMWRSLFMALGIFAMLLGAESLVVDQVVFASNRRIPTMVTGRNGGTTGNNSSYFGNSGVGPFQNVGYGGGSQMSAIGPAAAKNVFTTKDWMPWSLLASGAIIVMYTTSLPPAPAPARKSYRSSDD